MFLSRLTSIAAALMIPSFFFSPPQHDDVPGVLTRRMSLSRVVHTQNQPQPNPLIRVEISGQDAYAVIGQPEDNPTFVSNKPATFTHFQLAERYGTIGLMAHHSEVWAMFSDLHIGNQVNLYYQNQESSRFQIQSIRKFKALSPNSPYSAFIDLEGGAHYTAAELFLEIYGPGDRLVLQTCLARDGYENWGRWFVIAYPVRDEFFSGSNLPARQRTFSYLTPIHR